MSYPTLTPEAEAFWASLPQPEWAQEIAAKQAATGNTEGLVRLCDCGSNIAMSHCTDCHAPPVADADLMGWSDDYDPDAPFEIYLESQDG